LSWQLSLQTVWEKLLQDKGSSETQTWNKHFRVCGWCDNLHVNGAGIISANSSDASQVFASLPLAIEWLRKNAQENRSTSFQVKSKNFHKNITFAL
jgi:folylpolyglutamate synthase